MANLYPFHGHSPQIDPGAFVADTATIVHKKRGQYLVRRRHTG